VTLQAAWDRSDIATLRSMMTDEMLDEIRASCRARAQRGGEPNHTDVVMIEAQLLGIEDLGNAYMASVEFSGMIREEPSAGPSPFREVWNMTKPKSGTSGWLVAGVQAAVNKGLSNSGIIGDYGNTVPFFFLDGSSNA
jgi:predicted lipid-binding transport protein (Tim44 family)